MYLYTIDSAYMHEGVEPSSYTNYSNFVPILVLHFEEYILILQTQSRALTKKMAIINAAIHSQFQ